MRSVNSRPRNLSSTRPLLAGAALILCCASACGAKQATTPSASQKSAPGEASATESASPLVSPHDLEAPPAAVGSAVSYEERWWEAPDPCPPGTEPVGSAPPDGNRIGCKTPKGKNQGPMTAFHPNGAKAEQGQFANHLAEGVWVTWDENGRKLTQTQYANGEKDGVETEWYPGGETIKEQRTYRAGVREGVTTVWDEKGRKRAAVPYKGGEEDGIATYWDETGAVARLVEYRGGATVRTEEH